MSILVTGGLGYIGSHISLYLLSNNYNVIIIDNLSNSKINIFQNIKLLSKKEVILYTIDLLYINKLDEIFSKNIINGVIHCAGLKSVNESIINPLMYYDININITTNLLKIMDKYNCYNIVFSSSATVYGNPDKNNLPLTETSPLNPITPYGRTKLFIENILNDLYKSDNNKWNMIILRYFNPVGCYSHLLREDPNGIPNNLFPYIIKVLNGDLEYLKIFGNNYDTKDGTCIRDYIDINDLADVHIKSIKYLLENKNIFKILNVGTGTGISVKEIVDNFLKYKKFNYKYTDKRSGDSECIYCSNTEIVTFLNWTPKYNINDSILSSIS